MHCYLHGNHCNARAWPRQFSSPRVPFVMRGKNRDHDPRRWPKGSRPLGTRLGRAVKTNPIDFCTMLRGSRNKRNVGSCWLKSLTSFKLSETTPNDTQQHENRVCKRTQHVTPNNVGSCRQLHGRRLFAQKIDLSLRRRRKRHLKI